MLQVYQYVTIRVQSDKPILAYIQAVFSFFSLSFSLSNFLYNMSKVFKFDPFYSYC